MYAVVNIQGYQFKVEAGQQVFVNRMAATEGESVQLDEVLLLDQDGTVSVGKPFVEGASVTAKVVNHLKGDKIIVFKKKRRKGFRVKNGHRQALTKLEIESINA